MVENRPGGGTNIAVQPVVNSPPDGYTLLLTVATHTINPSLYKSLPFDFQRDIVPVVGPRRAAAGAGRSTRACRPRTSPSSSPTPKPIRARSTFASFGARTISHLSIELIKTSTGIEVVHMPYHGRRADA